MAEPKLIITKWRAFIEVPKWLVTCGVAAEVLFAGLGVEGDPAVEVCAGVLRRLLGEELMTANLAPLSAAC